MVQQITLRWNTHSLGEGLVLQLVMRKRRYVLVRPPAEERRTPPMRRSRVPWRGHCPEKCMLRRGAGDF